MTLSRYFFSKFPQNFLAIKKNICQLEKKLLNLQSLFSIPV